MAYTKLNFEDGKILTAEQLNHIEDAIYRLSTGDTGISQYKCVKLCLPEIIRWETNKPLYIFKHAITNAFDYKSYNIQVLSSSANVSKIHDYPRYVAYLPTEEETTELTFKLYDNAQNLLDTKTVELNIVSSTTPTTNTTVLFIGDSLVYYNRIPDEFYRIMTSSDSATTIKDTISIYNVFKPAGRKSSNINLIGTQKIAYKGWTPTTYHEGRSGWQWKNFNSASSPFYNSSTKSLDFKNYCSKNGFNIPDVIYIGLGWNDTKNIPISDIDLTVDVSIIENNARTFLTALSSQLPDCKIRIWTQNVPGTRGGIGNHVYGAVAWSDEHRLKIWMQSMAEMYVKLAKEFPNVEVVWSTCMIDSEYSLQESNTKINYRITDTEVLGIDYVHPADSGMFQIADAIVSDFMHCISGEEINYDDVEATELDFYQSGIGNSVMYYDDVFKYFNNDTLVGYKATINMIDVSNYVGKRLKITAAQAVIADAYYTMFTSKLPTGLSSIEELSNFTATGYSEDKTDMLEFFNISKSDKVTRTTVVTVPTGAKYLAFTNLGQYCATPYVGLVTE